MINPRIWLTLVSATITLVNFGCGRPEEVRTYEVPKRDSVNAENVHLTRERFRELGEKNTGRDAFYGAMVPAGRHLWLIEFAGSSDRLDTHADKFLDFVESLSFIHTLEYMGRFPHGTAVPGWKQTSHPDALLAFEIDGEEDPLVLTVTREPLPGRFMTSMAMMSAINKWRRQFLLGPVPHDDMADHTVCFHVGNVLVVAVNLAGKRVADKPGSTDLPASIDYAVPEGWQPGQREIRRGGVTVKHAVAFVVTEDGLKVEIAASVWPPAAAALRPNVDRWRKEVGLLGPMTDEQFKQAVQEVPVGEATGQYIELVAPEDTAPRLAIFAAIAAHGDSAWVFKLKGDIDLAQRQRESFRAFLKSVQFKKTDGADHGN